jgi:hypothetical protein
MKAKKPRPIKELLIILQDNLDVCFGRNYYRDGDKYLYGGCFGLCAAIQDLKMLHLITQSEYNILDEWLQENLPPRKYGFLICYCWNIGLIPPRKRWLNKQIEKL